MPLDRIGRNTAALLKRELKRKYHIVVVVINAGPTIREKSEVSAETEHPTEAEVVGEVNYKNVKLKIIAQIK